MGSARARQEAAVETLRRDLGSGYPETLVAIAHLIELRTSPGDVDGGGPLFEEILAIPPLVRRVLSAVKPPEPEIDVVSIPGGLGEFESSAAAAMVRRRVGDLERRKQRLVEAYVDECAIDRATYDRELGTLDKALTLANLELHETGIEGLEIEASLGFASHVLSSTSRLWKESGAEQKRKL